jgi:hypothetical protein
MAGGMKLTRRERHKNNFWPSTERKALTAPEISEISSSTRRHVRDEPGMPQATCRKPKSDVGDAGRIHGANQKKNYVQERK